MGLPEFDWVLIGPDEDGQMWLEWNDTDGKHSVSMGDSKQAQVILHRLLNAANDTEMISTGPPGSPDRTPGSRGPS